MLTKTFIHISGVGAKKEKAIWKTGIRDWRDFLGRGQDLLPPGLYRLGRPVVELSLACLGEPGGLARLARLLPANEHWRFYPHYAKVVYLDIETGGDVTDWNGLTVVGLYDGSEVTQFVAERDMEQAAQAMRGYDIVTTFGGKSFDLPFLKQVFPEMYVPPVHIDLRWSLARLGLKGGLKRIERRLGLERPTDVRALEGFDAVRLWREHQQGAPQALPLLLQYNAYDVINLAPLLERAVKGLSALALGVVGPGSTK